MVYIKRIEMNGFKSFGKNTVINLENGLVCITGPNGSGKSNILDAIVFAIGENSTKMLRVDRLHSLLHDTGSKARKVRVGITFDNSDRGLPVDSENVNIVRELSIDNSESEYYLNGRRVNRSTLTNMLEVALANRLNIVQQGMVMRIAELNREERRRIIEDMLGLSYFDEKKEEARKQLEEADRRLEVALAKIGEVRKRIDELERERNDQIRFEFIEEEIARLRFIDLSRRLDDIRTRISSIKNRITSKEHEASGISKELEEIRSRISMLEHEKSRLMREADSVTRSKTDISKRLSPLLLKIEQLKATITTNRNRIPLLGNNIAKMIKDRDLLITKSLKLDESILLLNNRLGELEYKKNSINSRLVEINERLDTLMKQYSDIRSKIESINRDIAKYRDEYSAIELQIASMNERMKIIDNNIEELMKRSNTISNDINTMNELIDNLSDAKSNIIQELEHVNIHHENVKKKRDALNSVINDALNLFNTAKEIVTRYKAMADTAMQGEDRAIALLLNNAREFNVLGLVQDLVSWDKRYGHAIMAAASDWLNAIVVKDVNSMLNALEYLKVNRLSRITIIPLDMLNDTTSNKKGNNDNMLMNHVRCRYAALIKFIFHDIRLVTNIDEAIELADKGYRVVTINGELFEDNLKALRIDNADRVNTIFRILLNSKSINELDGILELLKQIIDKKSIKMKELDDNLIIAQDKMNQLRQELIKIDLQYDNAINSLNKSKTILDDINARITTLNNDRIRINEDISKLNEKRLQIENSIKRINNVLKSYNEGQESLKNTIEDNTTKKNSLINELELLEKDIRDLLTKISLNNTQKENIINRIEELKKEIDRNKTEARESSRIVKECYQRLDALEQEAKILREEEQRIIDSSLNYMDKLNSYDTELKALREKERALSKNLSMLEKEIALNNKEVDNLLNEEYKINEEIAKYRDLNNQQNIDNYSNYDDSLLDELVKENNELRKYVNQLADKSYRSLIEGYRGLSDKKNQLEEEKNSIVRFIEQIEGEKKKIFMDAFTLIDREIRSLFSTMTDGNGAAWLEIEEPEDVFSSGIIYMVQFPNKPTRESNSLSGGEKTIAAITFLFALQSLRPAPFYLLDEIDAHLDSINTERLKRVIRDRSRSSQIIMVTLKDMLVATADVVYGVYAKDGISNVIRYKISTKAVGR